MKSLQNDNDANEGAKRPVVSITVLKVQQSA
jgi:hypothetical protein